MKLNSLVASATFAALSFAAAGGAQSSPAAPAAGQPDPVAQLRREIDDLRADYAQRIAALEARLAALAEAPPPAPTPPPVAPVETPAPAPVTVLSGAGGKNYLNLSLDGLFAAGASTAPDVPALEPGGHDPAQRGFTVQNLEMVLEGAVDPYFRAQANVILQISPEGESVVELEEAYATTTSLPHGFQLKVGQFFTEFGRLNPSHPHAWDFVDQPLVNGRFFGGDGLRSVGARISWLLPTNFYSEAYLTLQNSQGETLSSFRSVPGESLFGREIVEREVKSVSDLLLAPRYAASFDLSDTQTLLVGASAALGPNGTGENGKTRIYGVDGFWKWKAANAFKGFPFVKVQGELMYRDLYADASPDGAQPSASFDDWGGYLQINWGFKPGYVAGLRFDSVGGDSGGLEGGDPTDNPDTDALRRRIRLSPVLTWFPTEYSKLRLQYNFDRGDAFVDDEHSLWLQLEFLLGAHSAHKF
ncbi:MAG: hypothetical protein KBA72_06415 [Thermoanaerobaculia bacterium]|nr:hypothetical protein [Thermoanaerobaculia bacterium]